MVRALHCAVKNRRFAHPNESFIAPWLRSSAERHELLGLCARFLELEQAVATQRARCGPAGRSTGSIILTERFQPADADYGVITKKKRAGAKPSRKPGGRRSSPSSNTGAVRNSRTAKAHLPSVPQVLARKLDIMPVTLGMTGPATAPAAKGSLILQRLPRTPEASCWQNPESAGLSRGNWWAMQG